MRNLKFITFIVWFLSSITASAQSYDICVYGGTSAGVIAAYTAKQMGRSVILVEPGKHLGGLSSGGLGFTDIGNKYVVTGLAKDFYRRVGSHYGKFEQWIFEPHVAEEIFNSYIRKAKIEVRYQYRLRSVNKRGTVIQAISVESSANPSPVTKIIRAKEFIDCSYEGDLMARAGVSFTVGREANAEYNEIYNGVQLLTGHQFPDHIDPYKTKGDPKSGLLWGISNHQLAPAGSGDQKVQAYNYRICLTNNPANRIAITRPAGYDSAHYELLVRLMEAQPAKQSLNDYFIWSKMPNQKTDINNRNGFSTDLIGTNYGYPEGNYATRAAYVNDLTAYTKGLLYFIGHDQRVPSALRQEMLQWGYPKDEYVRDGHWSFQPYIREARRMVGAYVMTQANCTGKINVEDGIALAAYTMDSHNCDRLVVNGMMKNEGNVEVGDFPPYPIAYRALLPKASQCTNLAVPVCLSASHIAYGSIRMEPVFMVLAQVSAAAASQAINQKVSLQQVSFLAINKQINKDPLVNGTKPEQVIDNRDKNVATTGKWQIMEGHAYGPDLLSLKSNGAGKESVRFYARSKTAGTTQVYFYYPVLTGGADTIVVNVSDGAQFHQRKLIRSAVQVEGQTTGEWLPLGRYRFSGKALPYVEVTSCGSAGVIAADAVLFNPIKD